MAKPSCGISGKAPLNSSLRGANKPCNGDPSRASKFVDCTPESRITDPFPAQPDAASSPSFHLPRLAARFRKNRAAKQQKYERSRDRGRTSVVASASGTSKQGGTSRAVASSNAAVFATANSRARAVLSVALALVLCLSMTGCKDTDVLTQKIVDQNSEVVDETLEPLREETTGADQDDQDYSEEADTDHADEQESSDPTYDDTTESDAQTEQQENSDSVSYTYAATTGTEENESSSGDAGESEEDGTGSIVGVVSASDKEDTGGDEADEEETDTETPGSSNQGGGSTGGNGGTAQIYNDGTYANLPEGTKSIAATGQYALIVQMLGGKGALAAADASWLSEIQQTAAFPNEGLESVATGWSGDGTSSGSVDIDAIIASGADTVLTPDTEYSLTQSEAETLKNAGINVVVMPVINVVNAYDDDIVLAVRVVGELLKDAGTSIQYDAQAMASEYVSQHDTALNNCLAANGGYTTWMRNGYNRSYIYQGSDGLAGESTSNLSSTRYVMAYINGWTTTGASSSYTQTRAYWDVTVYPATASQHTVTIDASSGFGTMLSSPLAGNGAFAVMEYYLQHAGVMERTHSSSISSSGTDEETDGATSVFYLWFQLSGYGSDIPFTTIGDSNYPAIVTRTSELAELVVASANKVNGFYNYGQSYEVWVLPSGIAGSWADGTVESFLVAPWAFCMYQEGSLDTCDDYVNDFYKTFYRCGAGSAVEGYGVTYIASCPTS